MELLSQFLYSENICSTVIGSHLENSHQYPKRSTHANFYACTTKWTILSKYWLNRPSYCSCLHLHRQPVSIITIIRFQSTVIWYDSSWQLVHFGIFLRVHMCIGLDLKVIDRLWNRGKVWWDGNIRERTTQVGCKFLKWAEKWDDRHARVINISNGS